MSPTHPLTYTPADPPAICESQHRLFTSVHAERKLWTTQDFGLAADRDVHTPETLC